MMSDQSVKRTDKLPDLNTSEDNCAVCQETAGGFYFGAVVCLPCKSFFIRCSKEGVNCKCNADCDIKGENRVRCQYCRFRKCLQVGMKRYEKPDLSSYETSETLCMVCGDIANGVHFGVNTCEGCKKFFRRCLLESSKFQCFNERRCIISPRTRNKCRLCRYLKCLHVGMSKSAVRIGRPRKTKLQYGSVLNLKTKCVSEQHDAWVQKLLNDSIVTPSPLCGEKAKETEAIYSGKPTVSQTQEGVDINENLVAVKPKISASSSACAPVDTSNSETNQISQLPSFREMPHKPMFDEEKFDNLVNNSRNASNQSSTDFQIFPPELLNTSSPTSTFQPPKLLDHNRITEGFKSHQNAFVEDEDFLEMLFNDSKDEKLFRSKSDSNLVAYSNSLSYQTSMIGNHRTPFWNYSEDNLTQLYKAAEFLSLPDLTQISTPGVRSENTNIEATDLTTQISELPELEPFDLNEFL